MSRPELIDALNHSKKGAIFTTRMFRSYGVQPYDVMRLGYRFRKTQVCKNRFTYEYLGRDCLAKRIFRAIMRELYTTYHPKNGTTDFDSHAGDTRK